MRMCIRLFDVFMNMAMLTGQQRGGRGERDVKLPTWTGAQSVVPPVPRTWPRAPVYVCVRVSRTQTRTQTDTGRDTYTHDTLPTHSQTQTHTRMHTR